jgi:hypothetical protein
MGDEQDADGHAAKLTDADDPPEAVAGHVRNRGGFAHASPGTPRFPPSGAISMKPTRILALSALAAAWLAAMPAQAATQTRTVTTPGARLCTLSIPTTDTGVRPKAAGFRNEGTTNAFVICAFDSAPGQTDNASFEQSSDPYFVNLYFASIDGNTHTINCTGVNSWLDTTRAVPMKYVSKSVIVDPNEVTLPGASWFASDFGGATYIPTSGSFSVTCLLPPGVAILLGRLKSEEDVGS